MKKILVMLSFLLTAGVSTVFASNETDPDQRVLEGFKKEFPGARDVTWSTQAEFDRASFILAGRRVVAYFTKEGSLEGSVRDIFFDQLPLAVMTAVDRRFQKSIVLNVREISNSEGTSYKMLLEIKNKKYTIRVSPDGSISDIEKQPK